MTIVLSRIVAAIFLLSLAFPGSSAWSQNTVTYQGQLLQQGQPFGGTANLEFRLFDSIQAGSQLGLGQTFVNHPVEGGLFQVELGFSTNAFSAGERFIEVWVNGAPLSPRQLISATPVAIHALNIPASLSPFSLNTSSGTIEHASGELGIRFEPLEGSEPQFASPAISFGVPQNSASAAGSAVLSGGVSLGPNLAAGEHSVVAGGIDNQAGGFRTFVGGGSSNRASCSLSAAVAGLENHASGNSSFVGGGDSNNAAGSRSAIPGGWLNCAGGRQSWAGGTRASARPGTNSGTIAGGCQGVPFSEDAEGDRGTFVWADSALNTFVSSGPNQFLVRTAGGAVFTGGAVNDPAGNRLRIDGLLRVDSLGGGGEAGLCRNANNQLATCSSSARYKQDIEALAIAADLIDRLRPVQYRWIDSGQTDIGFVAEEVAELLPALVTRNEQGAVEGIKYERLTAVLVEAMQAERSSRRNQETLLAELASANRALRHRVNELETRQRQIAEPVARNDEIETRPIMLAPKPEGAAGPAGELLTGTR